MMGLKGGKITNHYTVYAVFRDGETYRVVTIDTERKIVYVTKAPGARVRSRNRI